MGSATRADLAASFQVAVIEILVGKTLRAARESGRDAIALSGGVSLNLALREAFEIACKKQGFGLLTAAPALCTDNAAMIAFAALLRYFEGKTTSLEEDIHPNLPLV
jgi:N6-L-threonylcarbamoyladenine synthase